MKISNLNAVTPLKTIQNNNQAIKEKHFKQDNNTLSEFPKGYLNISFKGVNDISGMSKKEKLEIVERYLWAKNWNEQEAKNRHDENCRNEISIRYQQAFAYLKDSTIAKIKEKHRLEFEKEKEDALKGKLLVDSYRTIMELSDDSEIISTATGFKTRPNSLDYNIAGYTEEKKFLRNKFVIPMASDLREKDVKIPNSFTLYGPTGCGKTVIAESLANETNCVIFDLPTSTDSKQFKNIIDRELNNARIRYLDPDDGRRTIIIVNEADNYLDGSGINAKNLTSLKGILDHCSERPDEDNSSRKGVTFVFTTNHPAQIDTDIFLRPEKTDRIEILPPKGKDFEDILKYYVNNAVNIINSEIQKGKNIKPINAGMPYEQFALVMQPSEEKGAFSCGGIKQAVSNATDNYIANQQKAFALHVRDCLKGTRDITPDKLKIYKDEIESIVGKALSRIEDLRLNREMGLMTKEEETELLILEEQMGMDNS